MLSVQQGDYTSVAWLDNDHIAFIYRPRELTANDWNIDFRVDIFEVSSRKIETLPQIPLPSGCFPSSGIYDLTRLPNGSLGFVFRCYSDNGISSTLYLLDKSKNDFVVCQNYPKFLAASFSFDPDMSQFIQENRAGAGLANELYLVDSEKIITKLLPDFKRARSPAWSSNGKTIAFAGTKENSDNTNTTTWNDIESLLYYPWDIYLMDPDVSNVRILLPLVGNVYGLKWSPINSNLLLFGGTAFDDVDGIWLLDTTDGKIKRLWKENTRFDWSPDGSKIVVLSNNSGFWWEDAVVIDILK